MLIIAASVFFFFHTTTATFIITRLIKINTSLFSHAIMHFHGNARRHRHIKYCEKGKKEFFHIVKVRKKNLLVNR